MTRTLLMMALLACAACAGGEPPFTVVPTTNDVRAWRQPWVEEARRAHEHYLRAEAALDCDPLTWSNGKPFLSQHPECIDGGSR